MPTESLSMLDSLFEAGSMLAVGAWALLICAVVLPSGSARHWLLLAGGRVVPLVCMGTHTGQALAGVLARV